MAGRPGARDRDWDDAHSTNALVDVHADDPEFGYRFLADELERAGHRVGERRVWRLCSQQRIWSTTTQEGPPRLGQDARARRCTTTSSSGTSPRRRPNLVWLTDITEHPTVEGKLYCCAIKDVFSNRIVGYAIDDRMTAPARRHARCAPRSPAANPTAPSWSTPTAGRQFRSRAFRAVLKAAGLTGSMGRVASAGDNAAMESFCSLLQKNVLEPAPLAHPRRARATRSSTGSSTPTTAAAANARLGKLTPVEFELAFTHRRPLTTAA